jgi:hypothetical protein
MHGSAVAVLVALSLSVACGDSATVVGGGGGEDIGGAPSDGGNGGVPPGVEKPACYDEAGAINPDGIFSGIEIDQGLCTSEQITAVYAACIGAEADTEACDAFAAADPANDACRACVLPAGTAPFPLPVILTSTTVQYLTLYGCQAQAMGLPECAAAIESLLFCARTSCEGCTDDAVNNTCVNYAINPPALCGELGLPAGCEAVLAATALDPSCIGSATTFETAFPVLAELYCGAAR